MMQRMQRHIYRCEEDSLLNSTDPLDNEIERLRILAFNKNTGRCVSNKLYYAELNEVINHPIDDGTYDFVFLANEPNIVIVLDALNGIYEYADLESIMYPEQAFQSSVSIPMFQKLENVEVLPGQDGARVDGGEIQRQIELQLERLATRGYCVGRRRRFDRLFLKGLLSLMFQRGLH